MHRAHFQICRDAAGTGRPVADLEVGVEMQRVGAADGVRNAVGAVVKFVAVRGMRIGTVAQGAFPATRFVIVSTAAASRGLFRRRRCCAAPAISATTACR